MCVLFLFFPAKSFPFKSYSHVTECASGGQVRLLRIMTTSFENLAEKWWSSGGHGDHHPAVMPVSGSYDNNFNRRFKGDIYFLCYLSIQVGVFPVSSSPACCVNQIGCGPVDHFTYLPSAVPVQRPPLAPSERPGSGWWLQPAELSATPVLH